MEAGGCCIWTEAANANAGTGARSWDCAESGSARRNDGVQASCIQFSESASVQDCMYALQGMSAAISRLEDLSACLCLQPADKSRHSISTLWTCSASTSSLAKVLIQIAAAGSHRRKLDHFVSFFTTKKSGKNSLSKFAAHGLINQAFAAALKTILLGHTACIQLGASSILELYVRTEELRTQLQALVKICMLDMQDNENKDFRKFPKGGEVLTRLYMLLLEPDPVHLGILKFLFIRTCEPYTAFIRTCIYSAVVNDPYGEFIVEQESSLNELENTIKVREGVSAPVFLSPVCTQLLRTWQELSVLLKHPETRDFAQGISSLAFSAAPVDDISEDSIGNCDNAVTVSEKAVESLEDNAYHDQHPNDHKQSAEYRFGQTFHENHFDDAAEEDLSAYPRGASWLDVGLPRNAFCTFFSDPEAGWEFGTYEESLTQKLVSELTQVKGLLSLASSTRTKPLTEAINNVLHEEDVFIVRRLQSPQPTVALEPKTDSSEAEVSTTTESVGVVELTPACGGGSWVTSLRCSPEQITQENILPINEDELLDIETPISVVVEKGIVQEVLTQYSLISECTVKLFREKLFFLEHCRALRRYYFMEFGDWADNFVNLLRNQPLSRLRPVEVQDMLEAALQKSSCEGDCYAERLRVSLSAEPPSYGLGNHHPLDAFDFIEIDYHVQWPLTLVLTPRVFSLYQELFKFLLRLRLVGSSLGQISQHLQLVQKTSMRSGIDKDGLRLLQTFRHQIGHFTTAMQSHVQCQLLHVAWTKFLRQIEDEVKDMQGLESVHLSYLEDAMKQCFLSSEFSTAKACIDNIMQCLLDFGACLLNADEWSETFFPKVLELKAVFHQNMHNLHKFLSSEAHGLLAEFFVALDYNGFFSSSCKH